MADEQVPDYGLSVLSPGAFAAYPGGVAFDLVDLMQRLVQQRQLAGFEVKERFYEIGSPEGLAELDTLLRHQPAFCAP